MCLDVISSPWSFGAPPHPCPRVNSHLQWRNLGDTPGSWDISITSAESRRVIPVRRWEVLHSRDTLEVGFARALRNSTGCKSDARVGYPSDNRTNSP